MNKERLLELADEIENPKKLLTVGFDMGDFIAGDSRRRFPWEVAIQKMTILEEMARETRAGRMTVETFIEGVLAVEKTQYLMQKYLESYRKVLKGIVGALEEFAQEGGLFDDRVTGDAPAEIHRTGSAEARKIS